MGYPIFHSQYTAAQIEASIGKAPRVNSEGYWEVWNIANGAYESTGVGAGVTPPTVVTQVSQMRNHGYVYIYNGSEAGYTRGYWYYWNGSEWTAGGAYQVAATDPTLSVAGAAADAKATGSAVFSDLPNSVEGFTGCFAARWQPGYYKTTDVGSPAPITAHGNWLCAKIEVNTGDIVCVHARNEAANVAGVSYLDENENLLVIQSSNLTGDRWYYVPSGAKYIIINNQRNKLSSGYYAYRGRDISYNTIANILLGTLIEGINDYTGCKSYLFERGYYSTPSVGEASVFGASHLYYCTKQAVAEGDFVTLHIGNNNGTASPMAYALLDANDVVVSKGSSTSTTVEIPAGVSFIVVNNKISQMENGFFAYNGSELGGLIRAALQYKGVGSSRQGISSCDDVIDNSIYFISVTTGNIKSIPDFPLNGPGWLWTSSTHRLNNAMQIAFPWNTEETAKYRTMKLSAWGQWVPFAGSNQTTNNYTYNTYEETNTITCSPEITTDSNNYLSSTEDQTDRAAEIVTMLQATGICNLGPGDFYVSGIVMPDGSTLKGCGESSRVILLDSVESGAAIEMWRRCQVSDLHVEGNPNGITLNSVVGTRHGILWAGDYQQTESNASQPSLGLLSNVRIHGFTGGGITCYNTGYGTYTHLSAVNLQIWNCNAGINISYWSEFHKFTNVRTYRCYYGCINNGGNNVFANCDFSQCHIGCLMDNSQSQSPNNTHGSMVGCVFNHSDNNSGIGIHILGCNNGFVFDGCQIFFSKIVLENCKGILVSNCNFGVSNCDIVVTDGGLTLFANDVFQSSGVNITITNNSDVHFTNCYERSTGSAITA